MKFNSLAIVPIISMVTGSLAAVVSASLGAGYWSIIIWRLTQTVTNIIVIWSVCQWRPGWPAWDASVKPMLAFGGNITGFNLVNYFSRNLDNILIGRYWGAQALGFYSIAYRILLLPIQQINAPVAAVALPALSRLQENPERYKNYYYNALRLITTLGMPLVGFSFASADTLILLLLGEQWRDAILLFRLLAPAAFLGTFNVATGWVFMSLGRADKQFKQGIFKSAMTIITFLICIRWGAIGMAAGFSLSRFLIRIPSIIYCYRETPLKITELANVLLPQTIASVSSSLIVFYIHSSLLLNMKNITILPIKLAIYITLYIGILMVIPDGKKSLNKLFKAIKIITNIRLKKAN